MIQMAVERGGGGYADRILLLLTCGNTSTTLTVTSHKKLKKKKTHCKAVVGKVQLVLYGKVAPNLGIHLPRFPSLF